MAWRAGARSSSRVANSKLTPWFALCDCERISDSAILSTENRKIDAKNAMNMVHEPHVKKGIVGKIHYP